jgi:hypothetical protein
MDLVRTIFGPSRAELAERQSLEEKRRREILRDQRLREDYVEHRKGLVAGQVKCAENFDKAVLTLAGSALGCFHASIIPSATQSLGRLTQWWRLRRGIAHATNN